MPYFNAIYNERFDAYLMYQERRPNSVPVTIAVLHWYWGGFTMRDPSPIKTSKDSLGTHRSAITRLIRRATRQFDLPAWNNHKSQFPMGENNEGHYHERSSKYTSSYL